MRTYFLVALLALVLVEPCAAQETRKPTYAELFDAVRQTINDNFYDPSFGGLDWKAMRRKYQPEVDIWDVLDRYEHQYQAIKAIGRKRAA